MMMCRRRGIGMRYDSWSIFRVKQIGYLVVWWSHDGLVDACLSFRSRDRERIPNDAGK